MKLANLGGWLCVAAMMLTLNSLRYEPEEAYAVDLPAVTAQIDTVTYGDARIVYKLSTDTARNSNGDLRRLPDLAAAPEGSRWRVIWSPSFDSVMLVTGDTFALSPMDSADATALATSWGVIDPHTVDLAWHVPPGGAPDPLENLAVVAVHDTLRTSWTSVGDSVRIFSGLDAGGQEDTFYVAGNATPHDRVVTTIPGDYYSCGNAYTTQAAADYAANRCGSATVDTTEPGGGGEGDFPNEPAGLTQIADIDFTNGFTAQVGEGSVSSGTNVTTVTGDGTTPSGDGAVVRMKFPDGEADGSAGGRRWDLWGPTIDYGASNQYDEIYIHFWLKVEGSDYQNQTVGTKVFYVAYGTSAAHNDSYFMLDGNFSSQTIMTSMRLRARLSENNPDDTGGKTIQTNIDGNKRVQVGDWTRIEVRMKINDIGSANGELDIWVDETLTTSITNWIYRSSTNSRAFYGMQFTPVYGGNSGDVRTRDDFWRVDDFYISAKE